MMEFFFLIGVKF